MTAINFDAEFVTNVDVPKTSLKNKLNALGVQAETSTTDIVSIESDVSALDTRLGTAETDITALETSVASNQTQISELLNHGFFSDSDYTLTDGYVTQSTGAFVSNTLYSVTGYIAVGEISYLRRVGTSLITGGTVATYAFYDVNKTFLGFYTNLAIDETIYVKTLFPSARYIRVSWVKSNATKTIDVLQDKSKINGIATIEANIATNTTNIATNASDISALETEVMELSDSIGGLDDFASFNVRGNKSYGSLTDKYGNMFADFPRDGNIDLANFKFFNPIDGTVDFAVCDPYGNAPLLYKGGELLSKISTSGADGALFDDTAYYISIDIRGQSNAFGSDFTGLLGTAFNNAYTHDTGLKIIGTGTTTAIEAFEGTDAGDTGNENVAHGICYWLDDCGVLGGRKVFAQNSAISGKRIDELGYGTTAFNEAITKINQVKSLAESSYRSLELNIMAFLQGESNAILGVSEAVYSDAVLNYIASSSEGYKAGYKIPFFSYQMGGHGNYTIANRYEVALAQYTLQNRYSFYSCVAPTYMFEYVDGVHMDKYGLRQLGLYFGRAIEQFLEYGTFFKPLQPIKARKYGQRTILVDFYVPVAPMQFSTDTVDNLDDGFYGLEVWVDGTRQTLASVEIIDGVDQIRIVTDADMVGTSIKVAYALTPDAGDEGTTSSGGAYTDYVAGRSTGTRGCLCDSDTTVPNLELNDSDSLPYDLRNYCVIFNIEVE